jgi:hypothetical protein
VRLLVSRSGSPVAPSSSSRGGWRACLRIETLVALLLACFCQSAAAHKPSDSHLAVDVRDAVIDVQWDIALRDLDFAIGVDADQDGAITWDELRSRHADIAAYALARLALSADGDPCPMAVREHLVDEHTDGGYAVLRLRGTCAAPPAALKIGYQLFFDLDGQHKGLARIDHAGRTQTAIFAADHREQVVQLAAPSPWTQFRDYVRHGVWHIWIGFDHILFLLSLLLPAVLVRSPQAWAPASSFRASGLEVLRVVTAFTVAHSITLTLAAFDAVAVPSRLVEAAIAASVVLAALNNIRPVIAGRRWVMAFAFGLIHGFGFASVLADLGLPDGSRVAALLAFNVGVELGQLAIVAAFLPTAWWLRARWVYRKLVFVAGSIAVAALAAAWFVERAFDVRFVG